MELMRPSRAVLAVVANPPPQTAKAPSMLSPSRTGQQMVECV